ncbi:protein Mdm4 isoform X2 [Melanerpes formicivorus]|uniref:protein Mdm4 isoform X2 n=1 Tax=Melanerpes formicivorus TaxID=211600 RepID=UPI00358E463D
MTSPGSAQPPAADPACRLTLGQGNQVRPSQPLLEILQAAGAQGEAFTLKEVMHFLGQYIMVRQLYDQRQQHLVHCGGDQLGELLGLESFSVKDPSPVYEMLKRNLTSAALADAAETLPKEQSVGRPSQDQLQFSQQEGGSVAGLMEGESTAAAWSTSEPRCEHCEDTDLLENLSKSRKPKLDLVFEEWDVAGLPWWFLGNLRSNYKSRSNGSTDIQTNQVPEEDCLHEMEDSQRLSDDTDTEAAPEDCWQCSKCKKFNSPGKRYCYRCWALRKDWYSDCPRLPHSLSLSDIDAMQKQKEEEEQGIDVPDCRRTVSAPVGQPQELYVVEAKPRGDACSSLESLDLARGCESKEQALLCFPQHSKGEEEEEGIESLESIKKLLSPCFLCQHRPRDGNIVHGRTAHLVACFRCAKMLKRRRSPCPVCRKEIELVIRIFMG